MTNKDKDLREQVLVTASDLAVDFLYYGRKEDELLDRDELIDAFERGVVTVDSITEAFKKGMEAYLEENQFDVSFPEKVDTRIV